MSRRHLLALVCTWLIAAAPAAAEPFRYPEGKHGTGELRYINGLPVLTVHGTSAEIGDAVGVLGMRPAQRVLQYPGELIKHYHLNATWGPFVTAGKKMVARFPADYQAELEAMVQGAGVDRDVVVVGNTLFDLKKMFACSALLLEPNRSATGGPLLGRNLDYPTPGYAHEYSLVTIYKPRKAKHAFASVGFPGPIGCLSGVNDAGLSVAVLEVFQVKAGKKKFEPTGLPYALCYRRLLEECQTIDEARDLLRKMQRTTTTNLAVADRQGVAVFEVSPQNVIVRRPQQGTCVSTNHFCSDELKPHVGLNLFRTHDRFQILEKAPRARELLSPADLHRSLHAASEKDETMQTMIFEPATLRLHLAIGQCPSSAGEMKVLELARLLK